MLRVLTADKNELMKGESSVGNLPPISKMFKLAALLLVSAYASASYDQDLIDRINNDPNIKYKAGNNEYFEGKTFEQKKALMGTLLDGNQVSQLPLKHEILDSLPTSFVCGKDKWQACGHVVGFIKDQAACGSCWAVAASEVIADRICIANVAKMEEMVAIADSLNEPKPMIDMSAEDIMTCCSWCGSGCQGGYIQDAQRYFEMDGVVTGGWYGSNCGCQPYQIKPCGPQGCKSEGSTPRCSKQCRSGFGKSFSQDLHKGTEAYRLSNNEAALRSEIYNHGSIECGFTVYESFEKYQGGVYHQNVGRELGGHAVKIIGWGHEDGMDYWLINNSWNTTWGLSGQFKYIRGVNLGGMEAGCATSRAKTTDSNFKLQC